MIQYYWCEFASLRSLNRQQYVPPNVGEVGAGTLGMCLKATEETKKNVEINFLHNLAVF
jgi:hypothetical protein